MVRKPSSFPIARKGRAGERRRRKSSSRERGEVGGMSIVAH